MEAVIGFFNAYWWAILLVVAVLAKVANLISVHWSERDGLKRWMLFLVDVLDIVKSTPRPGK